MKTLKDIFAEARKDKWAIPHFNFANLEMLKAIVEAAAEKRSPVLVGLSEGERSFVGLRQAVALIKSYREELGIPVFLNADHSYSVETALQAVDAGFDSVHIDLSKKPFDENLAGTKQVVEHAKSKNPDISIEAEIGYFVTDSSKVYDAVVDVPTESLARPEEAARLFRETGVDRLAPVVGGIHGVAKNEGHLDVERVKAIHDLVPEATLVLHGGSGDPPEEIRACIQNGMANIHISTDLRVAYLNALRIESAKDELAPYRLMAPVIAAIKDIAMKNMDIFGSSGKI